MSSNKHILAGAIALATFAFAPSVWAAGSGQFPAVALSYDGQYLAWIAADAGKTEVFIGSASGHDARVLAIPGGCTDTGLRWSPRWYDLAVMTHCPTGAHADTSALWVVKVGRKLEPHKIADLAGSASGMQWATDLKSIAFLYTPAGTTTREVAAVAAAGGSAPTALTPTDLHVHEFRLSRTGQQLAFTAGTGAGQPDKLYVQDARAGAAAHLLIDTATVTGPMHGLQITLPRWSSVDTRVAFIAGRADANGAIRGNLAAVTASGGTATYYAFSGGDGTTAYWYRFLRNRLYMVTQPAAGKPRFAEYVFNSAGSIRSTRGYFGMDGVVGDGRGAYSVSMSWRHWPRLAFVQRDADGTEAIHSGLLTPAPPPAIAVPKAAARP